MDIDTIEMTTEKTVIEILEMVEDAMKDETGSVTTIEIETETAQIGNLPLTGRRPRVVLDVKKCLVSEIVLHP